MRNFIPLIAAALLLPAAAAAAPRLGPEERLAREVAGRVAGEPVDCIPFSRIRSTRIIDNTAIIYDAGGTLYVNRPTAGRRSLDRSATLVTRTSLSQLCSIDTVQLFDTNLHSPRGFVFLGKFVPYRRAR